MNNGHLDCKADADKDCVTGKMHSCAISLVKDEVALFKFIACSTQDHTKLADFEKVSTYPTNLVGTSQILSRHLMFNIESLQCANDNKVDFKTIKACVDGGQGTHLCYQSSKTRPNSKDMPVVRFEMVCITISMNPIRGLHLVGFER